VNEDYGAAIISTGHTIYDLLTGGVLWRAISTKSWDADLAALCNALKCKGRGGLRSSGQAAHRGGPFSFTGNRES
jgi:hypothetical protein